MEDKSVEVKKCFT